jgi:hypothetical protein
MAEMDNVTTEAPPSTELVESATLADELVESALRRLSRTVVPPAPPPSLRTRVMAEAHRFATWPALGLALLPPSSLTEVTSGD